MSKQDEQHTIRRILVALDASHDSLTALEAAADLAATLGAELLGLFVEDASLLRLAGLPVAREMRYPFIASGRLNRAGMERALRAQAEQARRAIAAAGKRRHVAWSFRVVRGEVASEVLEAAMEVDLLTLGKASRPIIRSVRVGSTARAATEGAPCCVLMLQRDVGIQPPVVVIYDGTSTGQKAITMAARLAGQQTGDLSVLILADTLDEAQQLRAGVADLLRRWDLDLKVRYRHLTGASSTTLTRAVQSEGGGVLVLGGTILDQEALQRLLDAVDCPVMVVR